MASLVLLDLLLLSAAPAALALFLTCQTGFKTHQQQQVQEDEEEEEAETAANIKKVFTCRVRVCVCVCICIGNCFLETFKRRCRRLHTPTTTTTTTLV